MNELTLIFSEHLIRRLEHTESLTDRLHRELLEDARRRLEKYLLETTVYLSARGKSFFSRLERWFQRANSAQDVQEMRALFGQLTALAREADEMHAQTKESLSTAGRLEADSIHVVLYEDQSAAKQRLYQAICMELFRLAAAGGGEVLGKLPYLHYEHPDLCSYYAYYSQKVIPALRLMEHHKRFAVWAFQYREQAKIGPLAKLPTYIHIAPKQERKPLLPGEHHLVGSSSSEVWQGVGAITNIRPENIQQAQFEGVHGAVSLQQLRRCRLAGSPEQILDQCFGGGWYAVDPAHFFSMLSIALCSRTIELRAAQGQCLYCGAASSGEALCMTCISKIQQRA